MMAQQNASDEELLRGMKSGQEAALGELYDRYAPRLLSSALRILRNRRDAEDLIHDVFVEAWHSAAKYDAARGTVYSWLAIRVRSRAIDRLRSLSTAARHLLGMPPDTYVEADRAALGADCQRARAALDSLSRPQREVIELGYFRGLSCNEIATRCGIPLGTVKSRMSGALVKLRQQLRPGLENGV